MTEEEGNLPPSLSFTLYLGLCCRIERIRNILSDIHAQQYGLLVNDSYIFPQPVAVK